MGIDTSRRNAKPRSLTDNERARLEEFLDAIHYSSRYVSRAAPCIFPFRTLADYLLPFAQVLGRRI